MRTSLTDVEKEWLCGGRRRAAGRANGEEKRLRKERGADDLTGVGKIPGADDGRGMGICADDARCAGRAVLRRLELAQQIVVLERRRDQEKGVQSHTDESERPGAPIVG